MVRTFNIFRIAMSQYSFQLHLKPRPRRPPSERSRLKLRPRRPPLERFRLKTRTCAPPSKISRLKERKLSAEGPRHKIQTCAPPSRISRPQERQMQSACSHLRLSRPSTPVSSSFLLLPIDCTAYFYLSLGVIYFQASLKLSPRRPSTSLSAPPLATTINRPTLRLRLKLSLPHPSTALSAAPLPTTINRPTPRDLEEVHPSSSSNPPSRLRQPVKPTARRLEVSTSTEGRPAPHHH
jgi:hypothetical protein